MFTSLKRMIAKSFLLLVALVLFGSSIPQAVAYAATADFSDAKITYTKSVDKIKVTGEKLQKNAMYFVKLDDADKRGFAYFKVGVLRTDKNKHGEGTFTLPRELKSTVTFNVCLKNVVTDDLICADIKQSRIVSEEETTSSSSSSSKNLSFTVTRTSTSVIINTSKFPKNNIYFVRVAALGVKEPTWYRIGTLRTKNDTSGRYTYKMPDDLKKVDNITLCLKNTVNDNVYCVENRR
jgi:hypothetical protein